MNLMIQIIIRMAFKHKIQIIDLLKIDLITKYERFCL